MSELFDIPTSVDIEMLFRRSKGKLLVGPEEQ
jgi:hypothetical protein